MIYLMRLAGLGTGTGLKKLLRNTRKGSGGTRGRGCGDHTVVIIKATAGYIQIEQQQQPRPHSLRTSFSRLLKRLFMWFPDTESALSCAIRQAQKFGVDAD